MNTNNTPRGCAKDLIRGYVKRGDDMESLRHLGYYGSDYSASVDRQHIYVTKIGGKDCNFKFKLKDIYEELKHGEQEGLF